MMKRDDCYLDKITLKCLVGEYEEAINMAKNRRFHIYEGGEGKLTKLHAWMHVLYGKELTEAGDGAKAEQIFMNGINMPVNSNRLTACIFVHSYTNGVSGNLLL